MPETVLRSGILCPIDLTPLSADALRLAGTIAKACEVPLTVLHTTADHAPAYFTRSGAAQIETELQRAREADRAEIEAFVSQAIPGLHPWIRVEGGDPRSVTLRLARALEAGLIVMGTRERRGLDRIAAGSIAEDVLHASDIPVLTVGPGDPVEPISSLLCAVADTATSRRALALAMVLAQRLSARLHVLHVIEPDAPDTIRDLCAWVGAERPPGCAIQELTRHGHPAKEILDAALELHAGLLVLGAKHHLFSDEAEIGATTGKVLRDAQCPVLTVLGG